MAIWRTFFLFEVRQADIIVSCGMSPNSANSNLKRAPNCHDYLQWAVTPDWMDSIAL
jgi:hypothetical protein